MELLIQRIRWILASLGAVLVLASFALLWSWQDRATIDELDWPVAVSASRTGDEVTVTWLGVSTLLFDDGETQILTDGFFTRTSLLQLGLLLPLESDVANINFAMTEYRMNRLAAIVPLHSHFDHAMDAGIVANRSTAVILGSESTANIARGARVPVSQYQILADRESRQFGQFTIKLIRSRHAPIGFANRAIFPGSIKEPLSQPVRAFAYKEGVTYSVIISHPRGSALVQGSAGFRAKKGLRDEKADVVILGVGGLSRMGRQYASEYWQQTVVAVDAARVFPVHYDDFTQPFGELKLFPKIVDDVLMTARWFDDFTAFGERPVLIEQLPLGESLVLY